VLVFLSPARNPPKASIPKSNAAKAAAGGGTRHPRMVAAKQLPVTVGEPLRNERPTAGDRINTGVYRFLRRQRRVAHSSVRVGAPFIAVVSR